MAEDTITTPWWAAPASGAVVKPQPGQAYASTAVGAFGCDVRSESAARQGWRGARPALGSTASAPSIAADAAALRAAIVGSGPDLGVDLLTAKEAGARGILAAARTLPMLVSRRLVIVREMEGLSAADLEALRADGVIG